MAKIVQQSSFGGATVALSSTVYVPFSASPAYDGAAYPSAEAPTQIAYRTAGVASSLYIRISANSVSATSTLNIRKNGADSSVTLSIGSNATGEFEDTLNTESIASGDLLNYKLVTGGSGTSLTPRAISSIFNANGILAKRMSWFQGSGAFSPGTAYANLVGDVITSLESRTLYKIGSSGTLKNLFVNITANSRTSTTTFGTRKNSVTSGITVSVTSTQTGVFEDLTNTDSFVSSDLLNYIIVLGGTAQSITISAMSIEYTATNNSFPIMAAYTQNTPTVTSTTTYFSVEGRLLTNATEANKQMKSRLGFTASYFVANLYANTVSAASTLNFRKNSTNTALTISMLSNTTGTFEDLTHTVNVIAADQLSTQLITGATGTSLSMGWAGFMATTPNSNFLAFM
jgi:hypothetical protein